MTGIQWTDRVWNPTTGCDRVSPGCDNCYALTMARRLKGIGSAKYQRDGDPRTSGPGFGITEHPDVLGEPSRWRKPSRVFVNSMSDLFHAGVSDECIARVFAAIALAPQHTFQILTKRHARMRHLLNRRGFRTAVATEIARSNDEVLRRDLVGWPLPNVHLGVSVEDQRRADLRIPALMDTPATVRFLSCEPLLGEVDLRPWMVLAESDLTMVLPGLSWVIVGGESGAGARPMDLDWARLLVKRCRDARVPVFVKQLGSAWARDTCVRGELLSRRDPKGGEPQWWPPDLRVREFPAVAS
ncbi:MAG: DUF5131 family protein [Acidimicrobiia bacterium]